MLSPQWLSQSMPVQGSSGARELVVDSVAWIAVARDVAEAGGRLAAFWAMSGENGQADATVRAAYLVDEHLLIVTHPCVGDPLSYGGIESLFPAAARMQRAAFDLTGIRAEASDQRPWLRHAAWPKEWHPLRSPAAQPPSAAGSVDDYAFVRVEGDGVHEIPVGPVHAGIIEPGHFRFSVVGEKVLRLEERLGYVHKGIEQRFTEMSLLEGHRLAARICGDSAVAFSWAYCQALEGICAVAVPRRGLYLRALALELERLQNHLGDLGALGNDAGFAFGLAQFSRIKEQLLRAVCRALGQRYLFDWVVPGGTTRDLEPTASVALTEIVQEIAREVHELRQIYEEHAGLRDRYAGAGRVDEALARRLGLTGLAGRASGLSCDLRADRPWPPYDRLDIAKCVGSDGDVAARVAIRFDEVQVTCKLLARIINDLPSGPVRVETQLSDGPEFSVGLIEGWRGPVLIALHRGAGGTIRRCHAHDPSWQNWPVLEHAIIDNIVPDFPLINKSFNLAYSGHDL